MSVEACTIILANNIRFDCDSYDPDDGFNWKDPEEPVLNPRLTKMGLSDDQSAAVVMSLFEKFEYAFKGSGVEYDPCEMFNVYLLQEDYNWEIINWGAV